MSATFSGQSDGPPSNDHDIDIPLQFSIPARLPDLDATSEVDQHSLHRWVMRGDPQATSFPGSAEGQSMPLSMTGIDKATILWKKTSESLSEAQRKMFMSHEAKDIPGYLASLQEACQESGESSRVAKAFRLINPIFKTVNMYAPIAQTMVQADPTPSALVLGGITCIMSISSRFLDYQEKIADKLDSMGGKLEFLLEYGSEIYPNDKKVQEALVEVCVDILQFCSEAWSLFRHKNGERRSSARTFLDSLWTSFDIKFGDINRKFDKDLAKFKDAAKKCDRQRDVMFKSLELQYMQRQSFETRNTNAGIMSVGQSMLAVANQAQLQETRLRQQGIEDAQKKQDQERKAKDAKRKKVIDWLPTVKHHGEQRERTEKRIADTGKWLLEDGTFQDWRENPRSDILWIHGKRGCGKSYLASRVIQVLGEAGEDFTNDTQEGRATSVIAYMYCSSLDASHTEPLKLLGFVLRQLCLRLPRPEIEPSLEKLYDRQSEVEKLDIRDVREAIKTMLRCFARTFIVVDGLDECHTLGNNQFQDLCDFLRSLTESREDGSVVKVIAFSRPEHAEIKSAFVGCPRVQVDAGASNDDIKQFVSNKLSASDLYVTKTPGLLEEAREIIVSRADGMFLWADLVVNSLKGERKAKDIKAKLESLPRGLDGIYEQSMERILKEKSESVRTVALRILLWIANAMRPLSRDELVQALAVEPGMKELERDDIINDDDNFARDCADLIVLNNTGYYSLLHSSLKDYLCSTPTAQFRVPEDYRVLQADANKILAETCLTYLTFKKFRSGPVDSVEELRSLVDENPFLEYAVVSWGQHLVAIDEISLKDLTTSFMLSDGARDFSMQILMGLRGEKVCPYPGKSNPLHALAIFDLVQTAKSMSDVQAMQTQRDGFNFAPLEYALISGSRRICNWLLEKATDTQQATRTPVCPIFPLHTAAANDWGEVIERLIALGYDAESRFGDRKQAPLHIAACQGSASALEALLRADVNINAGELDGTTPLIDAAKNNHHVLAERLLENGANVNVQGWNGTTALHHAAKNNDLVLVNDLLQNGADKDCQCTEPGGFRTPLHFAVEEDAHQVVEKLISEQANLKKVGSEGFDAVLLACWYGHLKCLKPLLNAGLAINVRAETHKQTALHLAAIEGNMDIFRALFRERPRQFRELVHAGDAKGDTPLHVAVLKGNKAAAKFLLENGALANQFNDNGLSALHFAIIYEESGIGQLLLEDYHANPKMRCGIGYPPLHYAAYFGLTDFIPLLLKAGADAEDSDFESQTAVHSAAMKDQVEFVKRLRDAVPSLKLAHQNKSGESALHIAAKIGALQIVKYLLQHVPSSIQMPDNWNNLPFHYAAYNGHLEVLKQLETKENVDLRGFMGRTALFAAAARGYQDIVDHLLTQKANVNCADDLEQTPFYVSLAYKHTDIAILLLNHHADPRKPTSYGFTALHEAAANGNSVLVKRLLDAGCDGLLPSNFGKTPFFCAIEMRRMNVVDVFLEYAVKGCRIPDNGGATCLHLIAQTGDSAMLERLKPFFDEDFVKNTNCVGRDAVNAAAASGHQHMIDDLMALGLPAQGLKQSISWPLHDAAREGYPNVVSRLIELDADIDEPLGPSRATPLHHATLRRMPLITEMLVKAGANAERRDAYGLSCLDYAAREPKIWEKMGDWRTTYRPIKLESRMPVLRKTIVKTIRNLLSASEHATPKHEYERFVNMRTLESVFQQVQTDSAFAAFRTCSIERSTTSPGAYCSGARVCDICDVVQIGEKWYRCKTCYDVDLCSACYADYLEGDNTPKSAPMSLKSLRKLEDEVLPVLETGIAIAEFGGRFLSDAFGLLEVVADWLDKKQKEYDEWEKIYNYSGRFDGHGKRGQSFLNLIKRASRIRQRATEKDERKKNDESEQNESKNNVERANVSVEEENANNEDPFADVDEELTGFCLENKASKELPSFICSNHEFCDIPNVSGAEETEKVKFDESGKVTKEWLSEHLKEYGNIEIAGNTGSMTSGAEAKKPSPSYDEKVLGSTTESAIFKSSSITTHPGNKGAVAGSFENPTTQTLQGAHADCTSDNLSKEVVADTEIRETGTSVSQTSVLCKIDVGTIAETMEKSRRLERIKQELRQDMGYFHVLASHVHGMQQVSAEASARDGNGETGVNQGGNGQTLREGMLDVFTNEMNIGNDAERSDGDSAKLQNLAAIKQTLIAKLLIHEAAWGLAQIILGSPKQYSLLDELSENKEGKEGKKDAEPNGNEKAAEGVEESGENETEDIGGEVYAKEHLHGKYVEKVSDITAENVAISTTSEANDSGTRIGELLPRPHPSENAQTSKEHGIKPRNNSEKVKVETVRTLDDVMDMPACIFPTRQASISSLPPSPLSRRATDLFEKLTGRMLLQDFR